MKNETHKCVPRNSQINLSAQDMEYDPMITVGSKVYPFLVNDIKPIQLSNFNMGRIAEKGSLRKSGKNFFLEVLDMNLIVKAWMKEFRICYYCV